MKTIVIGLGAAVLAAAGAQAQTAGDTQIGHDIRCMMLMGPESARLGASDNPRVRGLASLLAQGAAYYLGRVEATVPKSDLPVRVEREVLALKTADRRAIAAQCRTEVTEVKARMDAVGKRLQASLPDA